MILTGKCADRFTYWHNNIHIYSNELPNMLFEHLPICMQYALIVEFMDGEGISIDPRPVGRDGVTMKYVSYLLNGNEIIKFDAPPTSRTETLKAVIEKGNEIYNSKN